MQHASGAKSGALEPENGAQAPQLDPELTSIIEAWPRLSPAVRKRILRMVKEADGKR